MLIRFEYFEEFVLRHTMVVSEWIGYCNWDEIIGIHIRATLLADCWVGNAIRSWLRTANWDYSNNSISEKYKCEYLLLCVSYPLPYPPINLSKFIAFSLQFVPVRGVSRLTVATAECFYHQLNWIYSNVVASSIWTPF